KWLFPGSFATPQDYKTAGLVHHYTWYVFPGGVFPTRPTILPIITATRSPGCQYSRDPATDLRPALSVTSQNPGWVWRTTETATLVPSLATKKLIPDAPQ
ncbi:MAG: hypothetical protein JZU65_12765, partial [Chlorobium sp.]|nr:hypothetical protein [Chlorobium sp.]